MPKQDVLAMLLGEGGPLPPEGGEEMLPEEPGGGELEMAFNDAASSAAAAAREGDDAAFSEYLYDAIAIFMEKDSPSDLVGPEEVI